MEKLFLLVCDKRGTLIDIHLLNGFAASFVQLALLFVFCSRSLCDSLDILQFTLYDLRFSLRHQGLA